MKVRLGRERKEPGAPSLVVREMCRWTGNGPEDERQENTHPEDSIPNACLQLENILKSHLPEEDGDLFLSLSLKPSESSVMHPAVIRAFPGEQVTPVLVQTQTGIPERHSLVVDLRTHALQPLP